MHRAIEKAPSDRIARKGSTQGILEEGIIKSGNGRPKPPRMNELAECATHSNNEKEALAAVSKISRRNQDILAEIAIYSDFESVALEAGKKICREGLHCKIAVETRFESVAEHAAETVFAKSSLNRIKMHAMCKSAKKAAEKKLNYANGIIS